MISRNALLSLVLTIAVLNTGGSVAAGQGGPIRLTLKDRDACLASGGKVEETGMIWHEICVVRFKDGGKTCTSNKQCQGGCIYPQDKRELIKKGSAVVGVCKPDNRISGCWTTVDNGRLGRAICVD